jgi:photosystem II stability/assembly factor-like uncharacterized protein
MTMKGKVRAIIYRGCLAVSLIAALAMESCKLSDNGISGVNGPSAPYSLSLSLVATSEIRIYWREATDQSVTGFTVQRIISPDSIWQSIGTVLYGKGTQPFFYTDSGLSPRTIYYRIIAYNSSGTSVPSSYVFLNTALLVFPPANLAGVATSSNQIKLTWALTTTVQTGFIIARRTATDTTYVTVPGKSTSFMDSTVRCGSVYLYNVAAYIVDSAHTADTLGKSAFSLPVLVTTPLGVPEHEPANISHDLYSVHIIDSMTAVATGQEGQIFRTTNGGVHWDSLKTKLKVNMYSVWFTDPQHGVITSDAGKIYRTTNSGATWTTVITGVTASLRSVCFVSPAIGYAVGTLGAIITTSDSGNTWQTVLSGTSAALYSICFADSMNGFAVGNEGAIVATTDGGAVWTAQESNDGDVPLFGVSFINSQDGIAVGESGVILSTVNGGTTWVRQLAPTSQNLFAVKYFANYTAIAVGDQGVSVFTASSGYNWIKQSLVTTANLYAVDATMTGEILMVGASGQIFKISPCY